ncbi:50S ribosomal protein L6 [Patescibacteria group bacterium]|nr:50S ribosomal protein L6 [Patescibacteria group bacterium]
MSKIGRKPINIPEGINIELKDNQVEVKGPNATLRVPVLADIDMKIEEGQIIFTSKKDDRQTKSNWGTMRSLVQNAVDGAGQDYSKILIVEGVGFKANMDGKNLVMNLGFSHPIKFSSPEGVIIEVEGNSIKVSGADKAQVGEAAANIRNFKKPEPYKGKGIRYKDEVVRRKSGKKATTG